MGLTIDAHAELSLGSELATAVGRLTTRSDANNALTETFTYDALNRLATAQVGVDIAKSFSYNNIGNILIKSDVGNYSYPAPGQPFPHAVSSISGSIVNTTFTLNVARILTTKTYDFKKKKPIYCALGSVSV